MKSFFITLLLFFFCFRPSLALTVTNFTGFYKNGQVFFTWTTVNHNSPTYKLYRSTAPITSGSQIASCEYLGATDKNSSVNHNLTTADGVTRYWVIQNGGSPLNAQTGLFVTTSVANGAFYYALLVTTGGVEDQTIIPGANSLTAPINETVSPRVPVLQEIRQIDGKPVEIYGHFITSRETLNGPLRFKAGWLGYSFAVYRNNATTPQGLHVRYHAGGGTFLTNITNVKSTELNLGVEDYFPSGESSGWIGSNEQYDAFKKSSNSEWTTGTNYFYTVDRVAYEIQWVINNFPVDPNKVWADGNSFGATGAFFLWLYYPQLLAAVELTSGMFNFGFENDANPNCTMNPGGVNRKDGNKLLGTTAANLWEGSGQRTYDRLNGPKQIHLNKLTDYPVLYSINGRMDDKLGWTEKTIWYDSVNRNRTGGYYFFDNRDHGGNNKTWVSTNFDLYRYARNVAYPAFSFCSINSNPGNGQPANGDIAGTINGHLNWLNPEADLPNEFRMKLFVRDLQQANNVVVVAPASCTADVTLRRRQQFLPPTGSLISWNVKNLGQQIQSGSFVYDGQLLTIPGVIIRKDTSLLTVTWSAAVDTFYLDADGDGYGLTNSFVIAATKPSGYADLPGDCNDGNSAVYPGATESCNSIDDDCDGVVDEQTFTASITPANSFSQCEGTKVTFTANESGMSYQWFRNEVAISGATKKKYDSKGSEAGTYKVRETNSSGCTAFSNEVTLTRVAKPKASIKAEGSLNICSTGSVTLKAKNGTGTQWQWYKNDVAIAGATQKTYVATSVGQYKVKVTEPVLGCNKTSKPVTVTSSCRQTETSSEAVLVTAYPVPATDLLHIRWQSTSSGEMSLYLRNSIGQVVWSVEGLAEGMQQEHVVDVSRLPAGFYLLEYGNSYGTNRQQVVIVK
ncbi:MAG: MopE-related protein [Chitinophagales bacterium]|nr:MopE-related protein [Chitinophagales bacterium]